MEETTHLVHPLADKSLARARICLLPWPYETPTGNQTNEIIAGYIYMHARTLDEENRGDADVVLRGTPDGKIRFLSSTNSTFTLKCGFSPWKKMNALLEYALTIMFS